MRAISADVAFSNLEFRQAGVKFYGEMWSTNEAHERREEIRIGAFDRASAVQHS
jgi:hypothetical protein